MARGGRAAVGCAALLLLACAAGAAAAEGKAPPQKAFVSWLTQQSSSKASTQYASDVGVETVCLQELGWRNCRCFPATEVAGCDASSHYFLEVKMGCCSSEPASDPFYPRPSAPGDGLLDEVAPKAVCSWEEQLFSSPITYEGTTASKIGLFRVTCEMKQRVEDCGAPLCGGLTITGQGDILNYSSIAFVSPPPEVTKEGEECLEWAAPARNGARQPRATSAAVRGEVLAAHAQRAGGKQQQAEAKVQYGAGPDPGYGYDAVDVIPGFWVGSGYIYSGSFWATSRRHPFPYSGGQLQLVVPKAVEPFPVELLPPRAYVARPNELTLELFRQPSY